MRDKNTITSNYNEIKINIASLPNQFAKAAVVKLQSLYTSPEIYKISCILFVYKKIKVLSKKKQSKFKYMHV